MEEEKAAAAAAAAASASKPDTSSKEAVDEIEGDSNEPGLHWPPMLPLALELSASRSRPSKEPPLHLKSSTSIPVATEANKLITAGRQGPEQGLRGPRFGARASGPGPRQSPKVTGALNWRSAELPYETLVTGALNWRSAELPGALDLSASRPSKEPPKAFRPLHLESSTSVPVATEANKLLKDDITASRPQTQIEENKLLKEANKLLKDITTASAEIKESLTDANKLLKDITASGWIPLPPQTQIEESSTSVPVATEAIKLLKEAIKLLKDVPASEPVPLPSVRWSASNRHPSVFIRRMHFRFFNHPPDFIRRMLFRFFIDPPNVIKHILFPLMISVLFMRTLLNPNTVFMYNKFWHNLGKSLLFQEVVWLLSLLICFSIVLLIFFLNVMDVMFVFSLSRWCLLFTILTIPLSTHIAAGEPVDRDVHALHMLSPATAMFTIQLSTHIAAGYLGYALAQRRLQLQPKVTNSHNRDVHNSAQDNEKAEPVSVPQMAALLIHALLNLAVAFRLAWVLYHSADYTPVDLMMHFLLPLLGGLLLWITFIAVALGDDFMGEEGMTLVIFYSFFIMLSYILILVTLGHTVATLATWFAVLGLSGFLGFSIRVFNESMRVTKDLGPQASLLQSSRPDSSS